MNPLWLAAAAAAVAFGASKGSSSSGSSSPSSPSAPSSSGGSSSPYGAPGSFDPLYQKYATIYGLPWLWVKAFALNESSDGQAASVQRGLQNPSDANGSASTDGLSWGVMQVTLPTARHYDAQATAEKLNDPEYCIDIACQLIRDLTLHFPIVMGYPLRLEAITKAYNEGQGNEDLELAGETPPDPEDAESYWERWQRNYASLGGDVNQG